MTEEKDAPETHGVHELQMLDAHVEVLDGMEDIRDEANLSTCVSI
jgi:hypothetical protein